MTPEEVALATRLGVAGLGGLMVGIEREWSSARDGAHPRFAGVRTFLMMGLIGGLSSALRAQDLGGVGLVLAALTGALIVTAYAARALAGRSDSTTEVAALLTLGSGALCGLGLLHVAVALFALTALVLVEKGPMHAMVRRLRSDTLEGSARFAVLALVILPLLPEGPYGPDPGIWPRELWALVLIFSGLAFLGALALRVVGPERGYGVAGLLGGLVSSTAVTLSFSREARARTELGGALALGVMAACAVMYVRMTLVTSALNAALGQAALPLLAAPFGVALLATGIAWLRFRQPLEQREQPTAQLGLWAAIQMTLLFQGVLYGVHYARAWFGDVGLLATSALLGLTSVDALIISMARLAQDPQSTQLAAEALAVGATSNTLLKMTLALVVGRGRFRLAACAGLTALAISGALALLLLR